MSGQQCRQILPSDLRSGVSIGISKSTNISIASASQNLAHVTLLVPLLGLLLIVACARTPHGPASDLSNGEWHEFQGTWTAAGSRNSMNLGRDRRATISRFEGSLVLAGSARPRLGFHSEAVLFYDTVTGLVGRAVWTDEKGDQAFSELRGQGTTKTNKITGTFIGGTGQYAGIDGSYEFSWLFLVESEDGVVQGQSVGLNGRVRVNSAQATLGGGGPRS